PLPSTCELSALCRSEPVKCQFSTAYSQIPSQEPVALRHFMGFHLHFIGGPLILA
ncbi:hypothetical protein HAX54_010446, partial [Datura stramonium]|nr:hypothetical protein [Datura stramonium]